MCAWMYQRVCVKAFVRKIICVWKCSLVKKLDLQHLATSHLRSSRLASSHPHHICAPSHLRSSHLRSSYILHLHIRRSSHLRSWYLLSSHLRHICAPSHLRSSHLRSSYIFASASHLRIFIFQIFTSSFSSSDRHIYLETTFCLRIFGPSSRSHNVLFYHLRDFTMLYLQVDFFTSSKLYIFKSLNIISWLSGQPSSNARAVYGIVQHGPCRGPETRIVKRSRGMDFASGKK